MAPPNNNPFWKHRDRLKLVQSIYAGNAYGTVYEVVVNYSDGSEFFRGIFDQHLMPLVIPATRQAIAPSAD